MKFDGDDTYTLSTGRTFYANNGIVGMSPKLATGDQFAEGYDGHEYTRKSYAEHDMDEWTDGERQELAEHMISLWRKWASPR